MSAKTEFLDYLKSLQTASPEIAKSLMTDSIEAFIQSLTEIKEKPTITESGLVVLGYLQQADNLGNFKAKEIATKYGLNSRAVACTLRKLASDGFCNRVSQDPAVYNLTEKGKNYKINTKEGD